MNTEKTLFEKIIAGEIPCNKIYEDETTFGFLNINPKTKGHALIIPKEPFKNIYEISDEAAADLIKTAKKVAVALKEVVGADGIKLIMNNDTAAGQEIFHAHIHIIPRFEGDKGNHDKYEYKDNEAEEICEKFLKRFS